jgi:hypothetical protein
MVSVQVVRTRMREPYNPAHGIRYDSFFGSLRDIYRLEGVPGMYSGMSRSLCASNIRCICAEEQKVNVVVLIIPLWRCVHGNALP